MGLKERNPHFHQIRNPKRTSADEKYLEQKWDSFARSDEGRRATKYKDFRSDLLGVADGDIAMLAKKAQEQGQAVFAFTDDAALQGVLGEISRDGVKQGKPPIIAGGLTDWRNYALKYFGRDYSEQAA